MVNADESEPGTCKDRLLMEYDPHSPLEGMLIAARTLGAKKGYIYIRGEYRYLIEIVDNAIAEAYSRKAISDEHSRNRNRFRCLHANGRRGL